MSCIHYKFKSSLDYNSVTFDGLHLSLGDLKKAISAQKRLRQGEFELEIINAQTGDVYKKSDELIAKNTSVIVSRVPVTKTNTTSTQRSWEAFKQECAKVKQQERQKMLELEEQKKAAEAVTVPASEMDKIKAVIDQSTKGFDSLSFQGRNPHAVPHDNYVCKRCGNKGHYITNCPNIKQEDRVIEPRVKRTTGIPSTMLTIVDDPLHPGALLTHHGQFAVPTVDVAGYRDSKKEPPPFSEEKKEPEVEKKIIPTELLCHICEDLCVDAAIAPCCGTSFCDECLREELLESEDHQCPSCHETNVSPDRIVANRSMRIAVTNFLNDTGYTKVKRRRSSSTSGEITGIFPQPPRPASPPEPEPASVTSPSDAPVTTAAPVTPVESISSIVHAVPSSSITTLGAESYPKPVRDSYQPRPYRGDHSSYKPWHRHESHYERPPHWNGPRPVNLLQPSPFAMVTPPPRVMAAAAAAATQAIQAFVGQRLPPPHLAPLTFPGVPGYPPHGPPPTRDLNVHQVPSPVKKKPVDVLDSFPDFAKKRSRTPELKSRSRSRSGTPHRRSPHSSYSPAKKGSHGRSPRRSSLSRSRSPSRTGSFRRSRSGGRSTKRSRSKTPPRRRRSGSRESRGLSELRSISPDSVTKLSKSRSKSPRPRFRPRSRSRSGSFKRSYQSRSRSRSKSKKARPRSYSPLSPRQFRRSPDRSPRRSPARSPRRSPYRSPRSPRSSLKSPGRSPLYSPIRSRSRRSFTPRRRSQSPSPRRRTPVRSKSRSPFGKRRPGYARSRSRTPPRKLSPSLYNRNRRSPSPFNRNRSPSPYQHKGGYRDVRGRERESRYPREDRGPGPNRQQYSPSRRVGDTGNAPPLPHPNASANLPPVQLLPNMALPPPEEYFKHNPAGYDEFLRTFYAQFGNQANPWSGTNQGGMPQHPGPPPGPPFGNSYPPSGQPNGPPPHPHTGFPQDRQQASWDSSGPPLSSRPHSMSPKYGDKYRRDMGRPGFDSRSGGRDRDRRFDGQRFNGDRNNRRGDHRVDDQRPVDGRHEDRKWRGDYKNKRPDDSKDKKYISSEVRDKRGARDEKRGRDGDTNRSTERSKDDGKPKERVSLEKKRSPQQTSKLSEKHRKGEDRKKKEEKENTDSKTKSAVDDKHEEAKKEDPKNKHTGSESNTTVAPHEDTVETKKENIPDSTTDSIEVSQEAIQKDKKLPLKKKLGTAGKKMKTKADGEKKEKKIKKKKLTFGASEGDKGLKKKKLKRLVDYKSENTCTSEDAADPEKASLSEPSPLKKAKLESNDDVNISEEKIESLHNVNPATSADIPPGNDQKSLERSAPGDKEKDLTPPQAGSKNDLMTELPELSKWEREDDFDIPVVEKMEEKPKGKSSLPRSVVDKAEMFIVGKPMKNSVVAVAVTSTEDDQDSVEKLKEVTEKHKDVQERPRNVSNKEKNTRDASLNRPKERDIFDKRDERHRGIPDRRRLSQEERKEEIVDRRKDYNYRPKSPLHNSRDYNSNRSVNTKDFRSKSPIYNKDYRSKSPNVHKDYRSKSPIHSKDYRSKSPAHNRDHRSKSPNYNSKDYRSKSPSEKSRKVSIDSKKDYKERKGLDIQITVKGDRDRQNSKKSAGGGDSSYHHSQRLHDRGYVDEDERSVVRSHSLDREIKSKTHKKDKEESKNSKRKTEKESSSKVKRKKVKNDSEEKDPADTIDASVSKKENAASSVEENTPHRSPRDLRHKIQEKTKTQGKTQDSSSHQRKLSVMDESEFVPDYEDTLAPEASTNSGGDGDKRKSVSPARSASPQHKEGSKGKGTSDENSSEEEDVEKEVKKHKKSKKKHKHKEKKDKKEKHKHKKKKHKKNKEKEEDD